MTDLIRTILDNNGYFSCLYLFCGWLLLVAGWLDNRK